MELSEIKKFFEENKETEAVKLFIQTLNPLSVDRVKDYLDNNEDGKKLSQSFSDAKVAKGIETFKEKTLPNLVQAEKEKIMAELNPKETEAQKESRLLKERLEKLEKEGKYKDLLNLATKKAVELKLPLGIIDKFLGEDEDATIKNIDSLAEQYNGAIKAEVESKFKGNGRNPHKTDQDQGSYYTKEQIESMSNDEVLANMDKVNQSLSKL